MSCTRLIGVGLINLHATMNIEHPHTETDTLVFQGDFRFVHTNVPNAHASQRHSAPVVNFLEMGHLTYAPVTKV